MELDIIRAPIQLIEDSMTSKRILFTGIAVGALLLASLGCVCLPTPRRAPPPTPQPTRAPRLTATPRPTATPQPATEMESYTNPAMGLRLSYPADWVYDESESGVIFAESEEALALNNPTEVALFAVFAGTPEDVEDELGEPGAAETPQTLLDNLLDGLVQEEYESGAVESRTFGETPGVSVEVHWRDSSGEAIGAYLIAAVSDKVAGIGAAVALEDDWDEYGPLFQNMFASLEFFPPETTGPIERRSLSPGETVTGTLSSGSTDVWTFDTAGEQYVTIRVDAFDPNALDVYVTVYDEGGTVIGWDDDSGERVNALLYALRLPTAGRYEIEVSAISGAGGYEITLSEAPAPRVSPILYGATASGRLTREMPREHWVFEGQAGDVVNITMIGHSDLTDTYLELYGPDDELLTSNDDSQMDAFARILGYVLPKSGSYTIVAGEYGGRLGPYALTLERMEAEELAIAYGQTQVGKLKPTILQERWLFEGQAGDVVNISMIGYDDLTDTYLELYDADGMLLTNNDDSLDDAFARIIGYTLPVSGTYVIVARSYSGQGGRYDLILQKMTVGALAYGSAVVGRLTAEASQQHWAFTGAAGDVVRIEMVGRGDLLDTYLELYGPGGELLTSDDDGGERYFALIEGYTLPADGTYRIVARSYDGEVGAYQLSLTRVSAD